MIAHWPQFCIVLLLVLRVFGGAIAHGAAVRVSFWWSLVSVGLTVFVLNEAHFFDAIL